MKKAIMNTMIILFALAMCVGCGQSSEQKEESVPTDVTKAEKQEQVQVEAEDEDTLENGEQVFRVVEVMPKFPGGDAELLKFAKTTLLGILVTILKIRPGTTNFAANNRPKIKVIPTSYLPYPPSV